MTQLTRGVENTTQFTKSYGYKYTSEKYFCLKWWSHHPKVFKKHMGMALEDIVQW